MGCLLECSRCYSFIDMDEHCHRCGGLLATGEVASPFCPHCGAPQLYISEYARATPEADPLSTTGAMPPPRPQRIDWKTAIRCAALVAGIAAVLSLGGTRIAALSVLSTLWILTASPTTLALYLRRRPLAWMDAGVGAQIGLVAGILLVGALAISLTGAGLFARFVLHSLGEFDTVLTTQLHLQIQHLEATNPAAKGMLTFFYGPEFRVGIVLTYAVIVGAMLLLVSTISGAVGGLLRTRRGAAA